MIPAREVLAPIVEAGYSDAEIGDKLGASSRTVLRWRKRYRLASRWTPPIPEHGTEARYARLCRCQDCRDAHAASQALWDRKTNKATLPAPRSFEPWTPAEDAIVLAHTPADAAPLLGRSWHACRVRREKLRRAFRQEVRPAA